MSAATPRVEEYRRSKLSNRVNHLGAATRGLGATVFHMARKFFSPRMRGADVTEWTEGRLRTLKPAAAGKLASHLITAGDESSGQQFLRLMRARATQPGRAGAALSRAGYFDTERIAQSLHLSVRDEFRTLAAAMRPERGDWHGFQSFGDHSTDTKERGGNSIELLINGENYFPALFNMISSAKKFFLLEKYEVEPDATTQELAERLTVAKRKGIFPHWLYDRIGSAHTSEKFFDELSETGVRTLKFEPHWPGLTHLSHRKLGSNGDVASNGGINAGDKYRYQWHDAHSIIRGPAVADVLLGLKRHLVKNGGKLPPSVEREIARARTRAAKIVAGDAKVRVVLHEGIEDQNQKAMLLRAIQTAKKSIYLLTPYFSDKDVVRELQLAVAAGVDVRLIVPQKPSPKAAGWAAKAFYGELLDAGVKVFEYIGPNHDDPRMTHAKVAMFDEEVVSIGSSNLDARSLHLNDEADFWVRQPAFVSRVAKDLFAVDLEQSEQIHESIPGRLTRPAYKFLRAISSVL